MEVACLYVGQVFAQALVERLDVKFRDDTNDELRKEVVPFRVRLRAFVVRLLDWQVAVLDDRCSKMTSGHGQRPFALTA